MRLGDHEHKAMQRLKVAMWTDELAAIVTVMVVAEINELDPLYAEHCAAMRHGPTVANYRTGVVCIVGVRELLGLVAVVVQC
jgi:hypothetical protein